MDLTSIDLNLLKLFDALVRERSVTQAGRRLRLSQPAASRALGRLRGMLGDRLVVRGKSGLELTPRAELLSGPVAKLLDDARGIVSPGTFDPATATGRIRIAALDHLSLLIAPGLMARFERHAPSLSIDIAQPAGDNISLVERGTVDLALGVFEALPSSLLQRTLYKDEFACILRRGHPAVRHGISLERYAALRHIAVTVSGVGESTVDAALSSRSLNRRIVMRVPHFLVGGMMVAESDMILTLPRRLANRLAASLPLQVLDAPLRLAPIAPTMIWHERLHSDPAHSWIRQQVVDVAAPFRNERSAKSSAKPNTKPSIKPSIKPRTQRAP